MISSTNAEGSSPFRSRTSATWTTRSDSRSCRVERLTLTHRPAARACSRRHAAVCRHASSKTHIPIGTIKPVSSAAAMKSPGGRARGSDASNGSMPRPLGPRRWRSPDRLVLQPELAPAQGASESRLHLEPLESSHVHRRFGSLRIDLAPPPRGVHRRSRSGMRSSASTGPPSLSAIPMLAPMNASRSPTSTKRPTRSASASPPPTLAPRPHLLPTRRRTRPRRDGRRCH